jgi:hypothetical protein
MTVIDESYATVLPAPVTPARYRAAFLEGAAVFARACDDLADAWPGQGVRVDGYTEGARVANHLRIVAATVRGAARRVAKGEC